MVRLTTLKDRSFEWIGGHLALDFTNTVTYRQSRLERERLGSYDNVLSWSGQAATLSASSLVALRKEARTRSDAAAGAYREVMRTRAELHSLFVAQATGQPAPGHVIKSLERRIRRSMTHIALRSLGRQIAVGWEPTIQFDRPLWPVLKATLDLLASSDLGYLRLCANPECGWMFLDRSRKGNRRWCSMRECGSRAKARAYYHRRRSDNTARPARSSVAG